MMLKEKPDIHWASSAAREVMLADLESGHLPLYNFHLDATSAWDVYKLLEEFKNVPFRQFERQLDAHRRQVLQRQAVIRGEEEAMLQFRAMNPRKTHDCRGNPVIDMLPVKGILREDVKNDRHVGLSPSEFRMTRPEYQALDLELFTRRRNQEAARKKHVNYLNEKSKEKREAERKRHDKLAQSFSAQADQGGDFAHV